MAAVAKVENTNEISIDAVVAMIARLAQCSTNEVDEHADFEKLKLTYTNVAIACFCTFGLNVDVKDVEIANTCTLLQAALQT